MKTVSDKDYYLLEALRINYDAAKKYGLFPFRPQGDQP